MARHDEGFFSAKDNLRLFWESELPDAGPAGQPRGHVIVVHGYQDHAGRYRPVIRALVEAGFAVHAYDFRGHGQSDGRRGFCDQFSDYVDDLELFVQRVRRHNPSGKVFLLAHSHGGLTTIHWLKRHAADQEALVSAVVLSAPYLKLAITPPRLKVLAAKAVGKVIPWLPIKSELPLETLSRDVEVQKAAANDPLYNRHVTPRWFTESNRAQLEALTFAPEIQVPMLVFYGSDDQVAQGAAARQFFEQLGSRDKRLIEYPGMRHEPMNEIGKEQVFGDIIGWISRHL